VEEKTTTIVGSNHSSDIYGTTGVEGDSSSSGLHSRAKVSTDEFRMELQSMINSMNSISESFTEPSYHRRVEGHYAQTSLVKGGRNDPLYDIPEVGRFQGDVEPVVNEEHLSVCSSRSDEDRNIGEFPSRLSNGSGIAYLLQNRHRNFQSSSTYNYPMISNSDLMNHNSEPLYGFGRNENNGPASLPLNTATIHRQYANPQIPVLNGSSRFDGNGNTASAGSASVSTNSNHTHVGLYRNNSLPRPHSIAAPQQSSFMKYRLSMAKKRDFV